ncbi:ATP-dependent helicase [Nocardiopsis alba]|uniref:ATP-dependent helicase n=1 Tax=Nocardiopsis alba TaxID=53437 RepID=UPI0037F7FEB1
MTDVTDPLAPFGPATRTWFERAFPSGPTPAQAEAWASVSRGLDTLVVAPTGSGKTLSAFLWALDRLSHTPVPEERSHRCRVVYVSPLKALAVDVERNLRRPLAGIAEEAEASGESLSPVTVGVRTGDTPARERRALASRPPDVLITTPESLFLVLTSKAREGLAGVETVIVDEVHALAGTKRGAHLALSLERLGALTERRPLRIGLSATVRPREAVAGYLGGARIVAPPDTPRMELRVEAPVPDLDEPGGPPSPSEGATSDAGARGSVWPHVERRVLDLVEAHRSTIVFTNGRRSAERLCARVNDLYAERVGATLPVEEVAALVSGQSGQGRGGEAVIARAHHGSMSKAERARIEDDLKAGRLRCVVATSSLELGVDMGAVDLVVQVGAPPSVASGLQRVGRAGHHVGEVSRGVFLPTHRGDLLASAVIASRMREGGIERLEVPRDPLDVLAQQIVSMVAMDDWTVTDLAALVRRASPYADLSDRVLDAVLDMVSGRYPSDEFAELRPRLVWDREEGILRARPGAQRLAVIGGGTIPDRGLYGVHLVSDGSGGAPTRVGELDEEMVYESRVGDVFVLGSSSWRIEAITADRVLVSPAPGRPGRLPFWKADTTGRPAELGRAVGALARELGSRSEEEALTLADESGAGPWAAENLVAYVAEQREATGEVPDDRTVVIERFQDQVGDWRAVVHSPWGARVNGPWAMAIAAGLRERFGIDARVVHGDDGIVLSLPDVAEGGIGRLGELVDLVSLDPETVEGTVAEELTGSALFASRFRECAARALLLPRQRPDRRMPLWQQRLRAGHLLSVAGRYGSFPIVLETVRECLRDVFDVPALTELLTDLRARRIRVVEVRTPRASPFARTLLMEYTAAFLYEGDAPAAEARAQALTLDPSLLRDLLGGADLRELLDPEVVERIDGLLQRTAAPVRDEEGTADLLREVGPLSDEEAEARGVRREWLLDLERAGRAVRARVAGVERWCAVEDVARLRDALGVPPPPGVPEAFLEPVEAPLLDLVSRYARTHGPFTVEEAASRLGAEDGVVEEALRTLEDRGRLSRGGFRPGGSGTEWCEVDVLRRLRRGSIERLRREVEPVAPEALATFVPLWQRAAPGERSRGPDAVFEAVESLRGTPLVASSLESLVLPARVEGYVPAELDALTQAGEVLWAGAGSLPGGDGRLMLFPAEDAPSLTPEPVPPEEGSMTATVLEVLRGSGALFFRDVADRAARASGGASVSDADLVAALWELVWAGWVTNDTLAPLRASSGSGPVPRRSSSRGRRRPTLPTRSGPPTVAGRWSLLPAPDPDPTRRVLARVESRLERDGVLVKGRQGQGFTSDEYRVLRSLEEAGRVRRGYFVKGLGGAQFALPGAVDRLRASSREASDGALDPVVLAASDPANPFGAALPWPEAARSGEGGRPGRSAGAVVVIDGGRPTLYLAKGGRTATTFGASPEALVRATRAVAGLIGEGSLESLTVERADGGEVFGTPLDAALVAAGFHVTPKGLRIRR